MRCLVTGGRGFIGSHVVAACDVLGWDVNVVDLVEGTNAAHRMDYNVDVIFHLAAKASIPDSIKKPLQTHNNNVGATLQVLELARRTGAVVVYSSSSSVGATPMTPYSTQKKIGEEYMQLYHDLYGVRCVSLRYFNVFGEGQEFSNGGYALVLAKFLQQWRLGKPFTITGTGEQLRDFVYVKDVARANLMAAEYALNNPHRVFEVGTGVNYSVNEIARAIDPDRQIKKLPKRIEPFKILADTTKFLPGWKQTVDIKTWLQSQAL